MTAFDDLRNNPREFLINTPLSIGGVSTYGTALFYEHTGANVAHDTSTGFRNYPGIGPVTVWNVPMIDAAEMADRTNLRNAHVP